MYAYDFNLRDFTQAIHIATCIISVRSRPTYIANCPAKSCLGTFQDKAELVFTKLLS
jgi:hypothetical protein